MSGIRFSERQQSAWATISLRRACVNSVARLALRQPGPRQLTFRRPVELGKESRSPWCFGTGRLKRS